MVFNTDLANMHVETIIKSIKAMLLAKIDLQKQLDMLSKSKLSQLELLPAAMQSLFLARVVSKLRSWKL